MPNANEKPGFTPRPPGAHRWVRRRGGRLSGGRLVRAAMLDYNAMTCS
ncbi:MAG: hypothetical protein FJ271_30430 [Planctomycetes bacterium]|nr:hypothetical protein [Planctomycetota bacterium]